MILTRARYLLHPLLSDLLRGPARLLYSSTSPLRIALPAALTDNSKNSLGYPWFLGTQTFSKNLSCSKIEITVVMTPHGFKGLILQGGDSEF